MGYTGPFDDDPGDGDAHIVIYNYIPSLALGALGTALFVIVASAHTFWFFKSKLTRTFEGLIVLGCVSRSVTCRVPLTVTPWVSVEPSFAERTRYL